MLEAHDICSQCKLCTNSIGVLFVPTNYGGQEHLLGQDDKLRCMVSDSEFDDEYGTTYVHNEVDLLITIPEKCRLPHKLIWVLG